MKRLDELVQRVDDLEHVIEQVLAGLVMAHAGFGCIDRFQPGQRPTPYRDPWKLLHEAEDRLEDHRRVLGSLVGVVQELAPEALETHPRQDGATSVASGASGDVST